MSHDPNDAQRYDSATAASPDTAPDNATPAAQAEKPFLIELRQEHRQHTSLFTPAASLHITPVLRTSGLLHALEPDALKNLLTLLTFLTPEGRCQASLFHLAEAMQISHSKAKARMQRLCSAQWHEEPVVIESKSENGYLVYSLHPRLIAYRHAPAPERPAEPRYNSRERVIEYSRQHYAHPRAEVEKMVARQLGQDENESEEERKLRYRLEGNGLTSEQARTLILSHDPEVIERQLEWLPYRQAKNPAGYLVAAIEGDYDEPRALRAERALQERTSREREFRWQDWQGQPSEVDTADAPGTSDTVETVDAALLDTPGSADDESPDDEPSLEETLDKADALDPEERWISLTPDE